MCAAAGRSTGLQPETRVETYIVDRIEDGEWAVLETSDGRTFSVPRHWLPDGLREGDAIRVSLAATGYEIADDAELEPGDEEQEDGLDGQDEGGQGGVGVDADDEPDDDDGNSDSGGAGASAFASVVRFELDPEERRRREESIASLRDRLSRGPSGDLEL
jgi:hypothetical protein